MQPNWNQATVEDGTVKVRWAAPPESAWLDAFNNVVGLWETEMRGQDWGRIEAVRDGILVHEVEATADADALRRYISDASDQAGREVIQRQQADVRAQRAAGRQQEEYGSLERRLREG